MVSPLASIEVSRQAADTLRAEARRFAVAERGGILVGYRAKGLIAIHDALVVEDPGATHTQYIRRRPAAQLVLDEWLATIENPLLGYVGEWHTHPAPSPPSAVDRAAARALALRSREPLALVVAALEPAERSVTLHALVTGTGSIVVRLLQGGQAGAVTFM